MQFREQGKKIQCIRSFYDPVSKRSRQRLVAAFDRYADKFPSVEIVELTEAERQELAIWFEARQAVKAERLNQYRVMSAAVTLVELAQSIRVTGAAMTDSEAAATWSALSGVAKALRKVGHPKPKRESLAVVVSGQADLLAEVVESAGEVLPASSMRV
jgi:hypothetical protein